MVGPIARIGTPGTSQYRVDWSPIAQGWGDLGRGITQGVKTFREGKDREGARRQKVLKESTLAEVIAGSMTAQERMSKLGSAGFSLAEIGQAERLLTPKKGDSFSLAPGAARFGPGGEELARNPATTKPTQRRIVKGNDGFSYYDDDKTRVLPGVKAAPKGDGANPFKNEQGLRKEYSDESDVFKKVQDSFRRTASSADSKSAAGDMALIFNFMKTLDPGSVVRESEFALAASAGSFGQQVQAGAQKVLSGERLTPKQRSDFMQTATRAYMGQADQQERRRMQYAGIAQNYGLDPGRALVDYLDMDLLKRFRQPQAAPAPTRQGQCQRSLCRCPLARTTAECPSKHDGGAGPKPSPSRCGAKG